MGCMITLFRTGIIMVGISVLVFMLLEPCFEGRNIHSSFVQIYFGDPFLAYVYLSSISFFVALYQMFVLTGYQKQSLLFSFRALHIIRYSMISLLFSLFGAEAYFFIVQKNREDDIAGGVVLGALMIAICIVIFWITFIFERRLRQRRENFHTFSE